ncbi:26378_t:CDS:2 [Dentiscutata erythropus]|uniref:26378_t:CDS:1 n=1 Tax=Dentiscutata erythropus TaxID=1348616 RepID=A0A9N9D996_9GLOM|nr:26378_t:CDS:2 [Dentiscutata erythropus]
MSNPLKYIQEKNVRNLQKKATPFDGLPPALQNRKTATLVLKFLNMVQSVDMFNPLKYIQEKNVRKLAKKSDTSFDRLPPALQNRKTATLVLKALKKDQDMPALVFEWNEAGFNDVLIAPGFRNGVAGQNKAAIITNLTTNGATSHNGVVFTFPNGNAIGAWVDQIRVNIPWTTNQPGVPNVCTSVTRINRITEYDTGTPSTAFDLENYPNVFF